MTSLGKHLPERRVGVPGATGLETRAERPRGCPPRRTTPAPPARRPRGRAGEQPGVGGRQVTVAFRRRAPRRGTGPTPGGFVPMARGDPRPSEASSASPPKSTSPGDAVGVPLGVGERQRHTPRAAGDHPPLYAEVVAQPARCPARGDGWCSRRARRLRSACGRDRPQPRWSNKTTRYRRGRKDVDIHAPAPGYRVRRGATRRRRRPGCGPSPSRARGRHQRQVPPSREARSPDTAHSCRDARAQPEPSWTMPVASPIVDVLAAR